MQTTTVTIDKKLKTLAICYIIITLIRLWIAALMGVWFPGEQGGDDALMVLYSAFPNYFKNMAPEWLMLKELGMPVFLQVVNFSGISYPIAICLLWILDGILLGRISYQIAGNRVLSLAVYTITIYVPASMEAFCGTRMYRAGLLNPMYVMVFALCILLLTRLTTETKGSRMLWLSALLGLVFSFTYYIKEDGIWLLAVLIAFALLWILAAILSLRSSFERKKAGTYVAAILLPFCLFVLATLAYKGVNYKFFGVFETNVRTKGESGAFVERIYKIDSENRTNSVWAPKDAIEKAFEVSPTLAEHPELKQEIYTSWWLDGDIDAHPIEGDFLTWVLKDAVFTSGLVSTVQEKEAFFAKVNKELDAAFADGRLVKESRRISLIPSIGGKTAEELKDVAGRAFACYGYHVFLKDYEQGGRYVTGEMTSIYMPAAIIANYNVLPINENNAQTARGYEIKIAAVPVKILFALGKVLIPLLLLASVVGAIWEITVFIGTNRKTDQRAWNDFLQALAALGLLAVSYVYSFMVMLFCTEFGEVNVMAEKMYSVGVVSLLLVVIVLGGSLLGKQVWKRVGSR
ncbi:MAG: hypothetical protein K6A92_07670 [Lachnospiraceae bacterium]|nr:hypothetical protein [Lachnospiraceae bacterium]